MTLPLSITILTKNAELTIQKTLDALTCFDDVIVVDNGSEDNTCHIASSYPNVTIHHHHFIGFGPLHNYASSLAKYDWILSVDSDEIVSQALIAEIHECTLDPEYVYTIPRKNYFNGKWIQSCGWYPDRPIRLYHRHHFQFSQDQVHEKVIAHWRQVKHLQEYLIHTPYQNLSHFIQKMNCYSSLFAEQNQGKKCPTLATAILHALWMFLRCYIFKKGFLQGYEGWYISVYNAQSSLYKYLKLREKNLHNRHSKKMN